MTLLTTIALGAVIGLLLGALGGGGSILAVPALVYVLGEPARAATTASLVIVGVTALAAAVAHARAGRVRWAAGAGFGAIGVAASFAGTAANRAVDPRVLLLAFAGLMVAAAAAMLSRSRPAPAAAPDPAPRAAPVSGGRIAVLEAPMTADPTHRLRVGRLAAAGLAVGFLTGFLGVGGGFVIVPALVVLGYDMTTAVGTSLLVIAVNSATAIAARAGDATFHWTVIAPFTLAAVATAVAGGQLADRVRPRHLTRAFAALLIAVSAYTAIASAHALIG
jgi:uncharacterized membrane protein YfcA